MIVEKIPTGALGANTYLLMDESSRKGAIVDPGGYKAEFADMIKGKNCELVYILLTHGHGDHIGGVSGFKKDFPEAKIVAAESEKSMLADSTINFSRETCGREIAMEADIYVNEGDVINLGELTLKFIMTPGHTPGGMCISVANFLFSGDTLFCQSIGRTDFPGGSFEAIISSIKNKLFLLPDDTKVLPGHMGDTTIGFEKRNNPFV